MLLGLVAGANARTISPNEALQRVNSDSRLRSITNGLGQARLAYTEKTLDGEAALYVFNKGVNGGYMILSADDMAYPILGYGEGMAFPAENQSPALKWWLSEYARQIEYARENERYIDPLAKANDYNSWKSVPALLKTKWDQTAPYNDDCPKIGSVTAPTGCVATAMAQVMNYFKYPEAGNGRLVLSAGGKSYTMTLSEHPFDWANMLDNYVKGSYNDEQAAAVANLMKACGFSVGMAYGADASGAQSAKISVALKKYFDYDPNMTYASRMQFSASEWEKMVYESLSGGSPVIYGGQDPYSGGHSFVCDGYDKDGYFHFNWGWSGMSDGFYLLNALNPEALGTGGGSGGGFNFLQDGVFNIQKPTGKPVNPDETPMLTCDGGLMVYSVSGSQISLGLQGWYNLGWRNETNERLNLTLAGVFTKEGSTQEVGTASCSLANKYTVNLSAGTYYPYISDAGKYYFVIANVPTSLPDGTYKMTLCGRDANHPNDPWEPVIVPYGYPNYVMVTKTGSNISATSIEIPKAKLNSASIEGPLFYRRNVTLKASFTNPTDLELTIAPSLRLSNSKGVEQMFSGSILMTLQPGETVEKTWTVSLYNASGASAVSKATEFEMSIVNDMTTEKMGEFGTVTMEPNPGAATVKVTSIGIADCDTEQVTVGKTKYNIYRVNPNGFTFEMDLSITKGYFDSNVILGINRIIEGATAASQTTPVVDQVFSQNYKLYAGEVAEVRVPISFPEAEEGVIYVLDPRYYLTSSTKSLGSVRFWIGPDSAVDEINAEEEGKKEYYDMQGVRIVEPIPGQFVIEKTGNKYKKTVLK